MRFVLRVIFFPVLVLLFLVLCSIGFLYRRKYDALEEEADSEEKIEDPYNENDDDMFRWMSAMTPTQRLELVNSWFCEQSHEVAPQEPFDVWLARRRRARAGGR